MSPKIFKKDVEKFIDLRELFPRSRPDFKSGLSKYQAKKIRKALRDISDMGKLTDFVPFKAGRKKYANDKNLPSYIKGIFLPGGEEINAQLKYASGELTYTRGGQKRTRAELYTDGDDKDLIQSAKDILKNRKNRRASITANGRVIGSAQNLRNNDLIIREAAYIFNKYAQAADAGEMRQHNGAWQLAAHPSLWGMGILFEEGKKENGTKEKNKGRKRK